MGNVTIRAADFERDCDSIRRIRYTVFVDEQHVPADLETDDRDALCLHVLALDGEMPVGTGRLDVELDGKIGRVAVLASGRRRGTGRAVMEQLHALARERGLRRVWCHAQIGAAPFYERLGYRVTSGRFEEAGIEHVAMEKNL